MATNFENYELETNNKSLVGGINELHSSATALSARVKVVEDLVGTGETGETLVGRVTELETLVGTGFGETAITEKVSQVESKLDALNTVVTAETTGLTAKVGALERESTRVKGVLGDATNDDLSKLHDLSASAEELNYMVGVTGIVQTQLNEKVSNDTYNTYTAATNTALDAKLTAVTVDSGLSVTNTAATAPKISLKLAADGGLGFDENNALKVTLDTQVFDVQSRLPESPEGYLNKIVLVPSSSSTGTTNVYTEYIAVSSGDTYFWEILGEYDSHVDLTPYVKKSELSGVSVTSSTGSFIASVSTDENGKLSATTRPIAAADIPELEISKVNGLQGALDSKQASLAPDSSITLSDGAISVSTAYTNWVTETVDSAKTSLNDTISTVSGQVDANKAAIATKQDKLTAGNGIEISTNTVSAKIKTDGGLVLDGDGLSVKSDVYATKESVDTLSSSVESLKSSKQDKAFTGHSAFTATTVEGALDELKAQVVAAETVVITGWTGLESALSESTTAGTAFVSGTTPENMYASLTGAVTASKDILIKVGASGTAKVLFANVASDTVTMHCLVNNRLAYITVTASEFGVSFLQFA